jgi:hypothetical protein
MLVKLLGRSTCRNVGALFFVSINHYLCSMEATLKFNLPDDKGDFELAVKAGAMYCVLWDFKQFMRDEIKYNGNLTDKEYELAERFQEKFFEILQDNAISLD